MRGKILVFASFSMAIAICLGALGAHRLKESLSSTELDSFQTAVFYHIVHALALLIVVQFISEQAKKIEKAALWCLMLGPILFSGSVYLLSTASMTGLSIEPILGPVTPIGGLTMIVGWVLLGITFARNQTNPSARL